MDYISGAGVREKKGRETVDFFFFSPPSNANATSLSLSSPWNTIKPQNWMLRCGQNSISCSKPLSLTAWWMRRSCLLLWEKQGVGEEILQTIHSIPLGMGRGDTGFLKKSRYSAAAGEHLWETILWTKKKKKNGDDCKLEMHFYDIVYQHEYSAWPLQAIPIPPLPPQD